MTQQFLYRQFFSSVYTYILDDDFESIDFENLKTSALVQQIKYSVLLSFTCTYVQGPRSWGRGVSNGDMCPASSPTPTLPHTFFVKWKSAFFWAKVSHLKNKKSIFWMNAPFCRKESRELEFSLLPNYIIWTQSRKYPIKYDRAD